MTNPNKKIFDRLGLTAWHEAGYKGKNGLSATGEGIYRKELVSDWWTSPCSRDTGGEHAYQTAMVFHEFAPERKLVSLYPNNKYKDAKNAFSLESVPYIKENMVDTIYVSLASTDQLNAEDESLNTVPYCTYLAANGNENERSYSKAPMAENIFGVGAYDMAFDWPANYTSHSDYVDFCAPGKVQILSTKGTYYPFSGTSCAAPALAGMCACINDFFIEKTGRPLKRDQMYRFLADCCEDVSDPGKDETTGWGLPILPKPEDVDVRKYAPPYDEKEDEMVFKDTKGHWAEESIDIVSEIGLMTGFPDGSFRPDQPLTRAQMAEILVRTIINET